MTSIDGTRGPNSQAYAHNSRHNTADSRPFDGSNNGTRPSCRNYKKQDCLSKSWDITSQQRDVSERCEAAVITEIMADKDVDDLRRNIPMDKITVTTERMMHVEIEREGDGSSEASAGGPEVGQRFRSEEAAASTDYIV